jgi:hypothetical protein
MSDYSYTVYVTWVHDGVTHIEEISGTGDISSEEDESGSEDQDLYDEPLERLPGSLHIDGDLVSNCSL